MKSYFWCWNVMATIVFAPAMQMRNFFGFTDTFWKVLMKVGAINLLKIENYMLKINFTIQESFWDLIHRSYGLEYSHWTWFWIFPRKLRTYGLLINWVWVPKFLPFWLSPFHSIIKNSGHSKVLINILKVSTFTSVAFGGIQEKIWSSLCIW